MAFTTAQRAIDVLVKEGILSQADDAQRDRVFYDAPIMKILDEPPKIKS